MSSVLRSAGVAGMDVRYRVEARRGEAAIPGTSHFVLRALRSAVSPLDVCDHCTQLTSVNARSPAQYNSPSFHPTITDGQMSMTARWHSVVHPIVPKFHRCGRRKSRARAHRAQLHGRVGQRPLRGKQCGTTPWHLVKLSNIKVAGACVLDSPNDTEYDMSTPLPKVD